MGYAKLDDRLPHHRKVREMVPKLVVAAYGLYVASVQFAQRDETDGRIREPDLLVILPTAPRPQLRQLAAELVRVHLWDDTPDLGGWIIHDYLDWNLSAQEREQQRRGTTTRVARYRDRLRNAARNPGGNAVTNAHVTSTTPLLSSPLHSSPTPLRSAGDALRIEGEERPEEDRKQPVEAYVHQLAKKLGLPT